MRFWLKVIRNGAILALMYFFSMWAGADNLSWENCKPVVIFLGTYIAAEWARYYGLTGEKPIKRTNMRTIIF